MQGRLVVDPDFALGPVDRRLFGSFVEHMGRCVYGGIFEPGHPAADEQGVRRDVLELVRELGATVVRYPGGNFVSGYRWEDGVGPVSERPTRLDLAWRSIEPNTFGLHEFMSWAGQAEVEPMLAVNLGTRGVQEAADLVEYANHPGGSSQSDRRIKNGAADPFDVKLWCLGNEMDGPWQVGQKSAQDYGKVAAEAAKAMRLVDPRIELVACGSSNRQMPTFAAWEATVLEHTYEWVDYISMHAYYEETDNLADFLASAVDMDGFIDDVIAAADYVRAKIRSPKQLKISFDEWNVWYQTAYHRLPARDWEHAPALIEDNFTVADAVAVGSYLISLVNHADRVGVACQAQLVNIIAPIRTEAGGPAWRQPIFYPFAQMARLARGVALRLPVHAPDVVTPKYGAVPAITAAATWDEETRTLAFFLVNRSPDDDLVITMDVRALHPQQVTEHQVLSDSDIRATNSAADPNRVRPRADDSAQLDGGRLTVSLPATSWTALTVSCTASQPSTVNA
ncbi:MAG: alpha-L-arabinofuranosidase [Pseudonocardiales bacterium]|nr:alpha-L-arabinofuranosidase [Pseudonocardiales bacterium]